MVIVTSSSARVAPNDLLMLERTTSAKGQNSFIRFGHQRPPAFRIKQGEGAAIEFKPDGSVRSDGVARRRSRLDLSVGSLDRDDLGGAEVFGGLDPAAQGGVVGEGDVFGADAEDELLVIRGMDSTTKVYDLFADKAVLIDTLKPLPAQQVAGIIQAAGFNAPVQFFQAGLMHGWISRRETDG